MDDKKILEIIGTLSLREKAVLCSGQDAWVTKPNPAKGIPALRMADGPHGLRYEDRAHTKENGGPSKRATCFPPEATLACAWSPELAKQVGEAIAEECLHYGVGMILGPGVNIKRSPLGGRNFEYYSEDPKLAGELAAGFISGVQSKGVGTSLKHYAVNNQEKYRMSINAAVDDRTLFDIYLKPFEIAVKKAQPATVMASYNRVGGTYATENRRLLTEILRLRFGFAGAVVSDWGAVNDRAAGIAAGCDLEMPYSGPFTDAAIEDAVRGGFLAEADLDTACFNLLRLIFTYTREGGERPPCNWAAHHALAEDVLCQSAVLLKNDAPAKGETPMLPLADNGERVAVIGAMAKKPRYQGSGSSVMNPKKLVSFLSAMKAAGKPFVYAPGYAIEGTDSAGGSAKKMVDIAVAAAKSCRSVVLFLGLPDAYECEGYDRDHLDLPENQLRLLNAVAAANPNVCVVLCCGSPVVTPWLPKVRALLCMHLGGEALGEVAVKLLYGQANPGGKLAETWPLALSDTPAFGHFPMGPNEVTYNEGVFVGYRYYDTAGVPVQFPFGYGLSYTKFGYSALKLGGDKLKEGEALSLSFKVKNTGARAGAEIAQVYLQRQGSAAYQVKQELLAFARVELEPGQQKEIKLTVPYNALAFHDTASGQSVVEAGAYEVHVAHHSRDSRLSAAFTAEGVALSPAEAHSAKGAYGLIADNRFPDSAFDAVHPRRREDNTPPRKGQYNGTTPLGVMTDSFTGRRLLSLARFIGGRTIRFSTDREANRKAVWNTTHDMPFKNVMLNTMGIVGPRAAASLLDVCNGKGGFFRFVGRLVMGR